MSSHLREPPIRWLGYGHVLGLALPSGLVSAVSRMWMTRTTGAYIALDTLHKATDSRHPNAVVKGVDALIWQGLASVLLPGLALRGVRIGSYMLVQALNVTKPMNRYIPLGLTLLTLPLFGQLMDNTVDIVLDSTTRPLIMR